MTINYFDNIECQINSFLTKTKDQINSKILYGKVLSVGGAGIECYIPNTFIGDICNIECSNGSRLCAEVISVSDNIAKVAPYAQPSRVSCGDLVSSTGKPKHVTVGSHLLGKVLDGFGQEVYKASEDTPIVDGKDIPLENDQSSIFNRSTINGQFVTGVKVIDTLNTIGRGQRMVIMAPAGVGKTSLIKMISASNQSDVTVVCLVGERGREANDFLDFFLNNTNKHKSILVVSTSDTSSYERANAPLTATAIAEYFSNQGKNVLLILDSLTRYCRGLREIGLAAGEAPVRNGYPVSIFQKIPCLVERHGQFKSGSITAFYTVLIEDEKTTDPIAEEIMSLVDGHIILDRKIFNAGRFPAINILSSNSRIMLDLVSQEHLQLATVLKSIISSFEQSEFIVNIGEYKSGSDPKVDFYLKNKDRINRFLHQELNESYDLEYSLESLSKLLAGS